MKKYDPEGTGTVTLEQFSRLQEDLLAKARLRVGFDINMTH